MTHNERVSRWAQVSAALALQSDQQLTRVVDEAEQLATGIGGTTLAFEIEGIKVFAKRLRLTDMERRPENRLSTRNIFELPTFCQRNVGSVGFGVWRELAANVMTTGWVLSQQLESFPLMYHWRVLDGAAASRAVPLPNELADVDGMVSYWEGSEAMGERLRALAKAAATRPLGSRCPDPEGAALEEALSAAVNGLGVGPQGLGGDSTAFAVHVELAATHITMNPVAVNMQCHSARRASAAITSAGVEYGF